MLSTGARLPLYTRKRGRWCCPTKLWFILPYRFFFFACVGLLSCLHYSCFVGLWVVILWGNSWQRWPRRMWSASGYPGRTLWRWWADIPTSWRIFDRPPKNCKIYVKKKYTFLFLLFYCGACLLSMSMSVCIMEYDTSNNLGSFCHSVPPPKDPSLDWKMPPTIGLVVPAYISLISFYRGFQYLHVLWTRSYGIYKSTTLGILVRPSWVRCVRIIPAYRTNIKISDGTRMHSNASNDKCIQNAWYVRVPLFVFSSTSRNYWTVSVLFTCWFNRSIGCLTFGG